MPTYNFPLWAIVLATFSVVDIIKATGRIVMNNKSVYIEASAI
jgi:hypothetical protein